MIIHSLEDRLERLGMLVLERLATLVLEKKGHDKNNDCFSKAYQKYQKSLIVFLYKNGKIFIKKNYKFQLIKGKESLVRFETILWIARINRSDKGGTEHPQVSNESLNVLQLKEMPKKPLCVQMP